MTYEGHDPDEDIEAYQQRFDTGTIPPRLTSRKRLWNSEEVDVEISSSFVESGHQSKTLLSIFRDIAERKRVEVRIATISRLGQQLSAAKSATSRPIPNRHARRYARRVVRTWAKILVRCQPQA